MVGSWSSVLAYLYLNAGAGQCLIDKASTPSLAYTECANPIWCCFTVNAFISLTWFMNFLQYFVDIEGENLTQEGIMTLDIPKVRMCEISVFFVICVLTMIAFGAIKEEGELSYTVMWVCLTDVLLMMLFFFYSVLVLVVNHFNVKKVTTTTVKTIEGKPKSARKIEFSASSLGIV